MNPTECKHCGCGDIRRKTDSRIVFRCWSSYLPADDLWTVSNNCGARCAVQLVELRANVQRAVADIEIVKARLRTLNQRVQRAVEVLKAGDRIMMVLDDDDDVVSATDVDRAIEILGGEEDDDINSPESPDSSPVTADQLATEDYYEAVRQQVPWMTAVEHIEGLVEGYRRCGVMVWQTAEEIRKVHGGEYGKAD